MNGLILSVVLGGGLGALLGRFGQCQSGGCPLTANWRRGALYGAILGLVFYLASGGSLGAYPEPKNVKPMTEATFATDVTQAGKPVVIDFYAPWCAPCKVLSPALDRLAGEFGDRIKFVAVDVDRSPALAARFGVQGVPTVLFIGKDGQIADRSVGLLPVNELRRKLETLAKR